MFSFDINYKQMSESTPFNKALQQRVSKYLFEYPQRRALDIHESHKSQAILLGIRIFAFVYLSGVYIWTLYQMKSVLNNVIYLTMMGYFGTWLYYTLTLQDYFLNNRSNKSESITPNLNKYIQIIYEMSICIQVPITIVFWGLLFKILIDDPSTTSEMIALNANLHAAPIIFLLIQSNLTTFSFAIEHLAPMLVFELIYFLINCVYSLAVVPIYKPINYKDALSYVIGVSCVLITLLVHYVFRKIYKKYKLPQLQMSKQGQLITEKGSNLTL